MYLGHSLFGGCTNTATELAQRYLLVGELLPLLLAADPSSASFCSSVPVRWACRSRVYSLRGLNNRFRTFREAGDVQGQVQACQGPACSGLVRPCVSLACRDGCLSLGSLCLSDLLLSVLGWGFVSSVMSLLIRTLILWNWGLSIVTSFKCKYFLKGPISNERGA